MAKRKTRARASSKKKATAQAKGQTKKVMAAQKAKEEDSGASGALVIAAVIIVGIIIFGWQSYNSRRIRQAQNENKSIKTELTSLKNSLFSIQSENEELKAENEDLKSQTNVLPNSRAEFKNSKLGLKFTYPAVWGELKLVASAGDTGKRYKGEFSHNENLVLGGIDGQFTSSEDGNFLDTQGFRKRSGVYFYKSTGEDSGDENMTTYRIEPLEVINFSNGEILIVDSSSFIDEDLEAANMFSPGQDGLGAIVNLNNDLFPGLAIWDKNKNELTLDEFEEFLETMVVEGVGEEEIVEEVSEEAAE